MTFVIIAVVAVWWLLGVASFIYWWTSDWEFTTSDIPFAAFVGVMGPVGFLSGWLVHGKPKYDSPKTKTLIKRRGSK